MKGISVVFIICLTVGANCFCQVDTSVKLMSYSQYMQIKNPIGNQVNSNLDFSYLKESKLFYVNTNGSFQTVYLISENGEVYDQGFSPTEKFRMNFNRINFVGNTSQPRDSFNPYGATGTYDALFFGTINTIIGFVNKRKRK